MRIIARSPESRLLALVAEVVARVLVPYRFVWWCSHWQD